MSRYLVRRLLWGAGLMLAISFATYAVFAIIPYNPGRILFPPGSAVTPAQLTIADHTLGVDKPFYVQYEHFLQQLLEHGSLGTSFTGTSINTIIANTAPVTALLILGGALLMLAVAVPLAVLSARHANTGIDRAVLAVSVLGIALHPFVVGVVLKQLFGHTFGLLPEGGYCPLHHIQPPATFFDQTVHRQVPFNSLTHAQLVQDGYYLFPAGYCSQAPWPISWLKHMLLPWATFALFFLPFYVRMIRTRLLDSYQERYVLTARAKGASELRILTGHLLRPVSATVATMFAFDVGVGITAAMYVETVYGLPGLANQALIALGTSGSFEAGYDLPTMTGIVITVAAAIVVLNIAADLAASRLDPRIKLV